MDIHNFLSSLSPIFRIKDVSIIWSGNVYKIGQTNCLNPRLLVIASPGIFLIKKKPFNFQSRITTSISFFDLVSLHVTEQGVSFSSKQSQIRVKLQNAKEIVSLVVFIRQAQFPTDVLPLNFTFVDEEMANLDTPEKLPYQPVSLFLDRMLSCICHFESIPSDSLLSEIPTQFFRKYTITKEMLQTPLLPAWILSLSYDRDIEILRFESIKFVQFLEKSKYLFSFNKFVKTVEFSKVDFANSDSILANLFQQVHSFKPINWIFLECDLTSQNFSKFFNSISFIGKKISSIQFQNCTFSEDVLLDIFQSIFFNDCFHSIENLELNSNAIKSENNSMVYDAFLSQISEVLCCSWVLQQKCLSNISLNSSKVGDMTKILSQIFTFDTGLKIISLNDNDFLSPLKIDGELDSKTSILISFISFRKSRLSKSFIQSLISLIQKEKVIFTGIDLSQIEIVNDDGSPMIDSVNEETTNSDTIKIKDKSDNENEEKNQIQTENQNDNENNLSNQNINENQNQNDLVLKSKNIGLDFLLNELQNVSIQSLEVLFFDENRMNASQTIQFVNFLKKQPNLTNISINCSIDVSNSPFGFLSFINFCENQNIISLSIRGDSAKSIELSYGLLNLNLIQKIQSIECLDISNQKIGQKGIELLLPLIENGKLKEIYFDGSEVNSFQFLHKFCTAILKSKISYASFPENDFQRILSLNKNSNYISLITETENGDENLEDAYKDLKNQFHSLFYFSEKNSSSTIRKKATKIKKYSFEKKMPNQSISKTNENMLLSNRIEDSEQVKNASLKSNIIDSKIIENCIFNYKIRNSYAECIENAKVKPSESIVSLVQTIQDSLSFDNLFNSL